MEWLKESWGYLVLGTLFIGSLFKAIQASFASERDRQALKNANLEREKLQLEVDRLRNSPEAVKDRREVYDKLRQLIQSIAMAGSADFAQIKMLQELKHDSVIRFPPDVIREIDTLIEAVGNLWASGQNLQKGRGNVKHDRWEQIVKQNSDTKMEVVAFERTMVDLFRPLPNSISPAKRMREGLLSNSFVALVRSYRATRATTSKQTLWSRNVTDSNSL